jgi:hypothetical protein
MKINLDDHRLEIKLKVWDAFIKTLTVLLLICAALLGVFTYRTQSRQEEQHRLREYGLTVYKTRMDIYAELTDAAARFSFASDRAEVKKAEQRFKELYIGKSSLLENQSVHDTLMMFYEMLVKWNDCKEESSNGTPYIFSELTYNLALACRLNLAETFPLEITPLNYGSDYMALTEQQVKQNNERLKNRMGELCEN